MGRRGRNAVITGPKETAYSGERTEPPARMSRAAKQQWRKITNDFPPKFHQSKHLPLLEDFCESLALSIRARKQLLKEDVTITNKVTGMTRKNPLIDIIQSEVKIRGQLAVKLSLVIPTSRTGGDTAHTPGPLETPSEEKLRYIYGELEKKSVLSAKEQNLFNKLKKEYGSENN